MKKILQFFRNKKYRNAEMVKWWMTKEAVEAKVVKNPNGHYEMWMEGEKYAFPGYPRGSLLYGSLSPLKHLIKNKIFNEVYAIKENKDEAIQRAKSNLLEIFSLSETGKPTDSQSVEMKPYKYDLIPFELLNPPVKEIWRAMSTIETSDNWRKLKEIICFILQEDDAYRNRLQYIVKFFPKWWKPTIKQFEYGLWMLEQAEVVGDMKEKQKLFREIFMLILKDTIIRAKFEQFLQEVDWSKVKLSKADKYFFRAKYFKVDFPEYLY